MIAHQISFWAKAFNGSLRSLVSLVMRIMSLQGARQR